MKSELPDLNLRLIMKVFTLVFGFLILLFFSSFIKCAGENSFDAIALNNEGVQALNRKEWTLAISKFKEALDFDPADKTAKSNLAIAYNNYAIEIMKTRRTYFEALKQFHNAIFFDPTNELNQLDADQLLRKMGKDPNSFKDRVELAEKAKRSNDLIGADVEYRAALSIKNDKRIVAQLSEIDQLYRKKNDCENSTVGDIRKLELWIKELIETDHYTSDFRNPVEKRKEKGDFGLRLVYAIDKVRLELKMKNLSRKQKERIDFAIDNLTSRSGTYQQNSKLPKTATPQQELKQSVEQTIEPITSENAHSHETADIPTFFDHHDLKRKNHEISEEDFLYGEKQLSQMIKERPAMSKYIRNGDTVWRWCARQFAGESTGSRYSWLGTTFNTHGLGGWHTYPYPSGHYGTITVGQKYNMPNDGDKLWSIAIFELLNIRNDTSFLALDKYANVGKINQNEHIKQTAKLEFLVLDSLCFFFEHYWKDHCAKLQASTDSKNWCITSSESFEKWFEAIPKDSAYLKQYSRRTPVMPRQQ